MIYGSCRRRQEAKAVIGYTHHMASFRSRSPQTGHEYRRNAAVTDQHSHRPVV